MGREDDGELELVLSRLTDELSSVAKRTDDIFAEIKHDVAVLKDTKYRPYLTSLGLFSAISIGVISYVYNMEMQFIRSIFEVSDRIHDIDNRALANHEAISALEDRLKQRMINQQKALDRIDGRLSDMQRTLDLNLSVKAVK